MGRQAAEEGCESGKEAKREAWTALQKRKKHLQGLLRQAKPELGLCLPWMLLSADLTAECVCSGIKPGMHFSTKEPGSGFHTSS